ncbi:hypothetical protein AUP68_13748 [Ilyonectria robusta]
MSSMSPTAVIAGEWVLLSLAIILVAARLYVRLYMNKDRIYWSDAWLLIAVCSALGLVICDTLAYKANAMFNFVDPGVRMLKIRFAVNYFFDTGMYFPKFSIIAFYYALVPPTQPKMRIALYTLTGITVASCLVTFFDATLWCGADIASNCINSSDYKSGYRGTSTDARSRTNRSKATHTQGSGAYWRTGTQTKGGVFKDDAGSEVQLNDLKSGRVMKTEEIRISVETLSNGDSVEYPAGPRKPMGIETSVMA